jgi:hypothetical protein
MSGFVRAKKDSCDGRPSPVGTFQLLSPDFHRLQADSDSSQERISPNYNDLCLYSRQDSMNALLKRGLDIADPAAREDTNGSPKLAEGSPCIPRPPGVEASVLTLRPSDIWIALAPTVSRKFDSPRRHPFGEKS